MSEPMCKSCRNIGWPGYNKNNFFINFVPHGSKGGNFPSAPPWDTHRYRVPHRRAWHLRYPRRQRTVRVDAQCYPVVACIPHSIGRPSMLPAFDSHQSGCSHCDWIGPFVSASSGAGVSLQPTLPLSSPTDVLADCLIIFSSNIRWYGRKLASDWWSAFNVGILRCKSNAGYSLHVFDSSIGFSFVAIFFETRNFFISIYECRVE